MTALEFFIDATTGSILLSCQELIMYRCPLCMDLYTKQVIKQHLEVHHNLVIK